MRRRWAYYVSADCRDDMSLTVKCGLRDSVKELHVIGLKTQVRFNDR